MPKRACKRHSVGTEKRARKRHSVGTEKRACKRHSVGEDLAAQARVDTELSRHFGGRAVTRVDYYQLYVLLTDGLWEDTADLTEYLLERPGDFGCLAETVRLRGLGG